MQGRCIDIDLELSLVSSRVPLASAVPGSMDENVVVGGCSLTPARHARLGVLQHWGARDNWGQVRRLGIDETFCCARFGIRKLPNSEVGGH